MAKTRQIVVTAVIGPDADGIEVRRQAEEVVTERAGELGVSKVETRGKPPSLIEREVLLVADFDGSEVAAHAAGQEIAGAIQGACEGLSDVQWAVVWTGGAG